MTNSRSPDHFRRIYQSSADPWSFDSPYEQGKYRRTLEVLGERRFSSGVEVGCSIGVLTRMLAPRCDNLLGIDIVEEPLQAAKARCADQPQVQFQRMQVPGDWPDRHFDLILFSEVLYFLSAADIDRCVERVLGCILPGAVVLLVNWLGQSDDPNTGDQAADRFINSAAGALTVRLQERHDGYRLVVLGR